MQIVIEGYASVFGVADRFGDIVCKGAFLKSLDRQKPTILFQHKEEQGSLVECFEDDYGLKVKASLGFAGLIGTIRLLNMLDDDLKGLSIGFRTEECEIKVGKRYLKVLDLREISLVHFPAHELCSFKIVGLSQESLSILKTQLLESLES